MSNKVIPPLRAGTLRQFGYSTHESRDMRHMALVRAVRKYGRTTVWRKLNALVVLNKHRPEIRRIFQADKEWIAGSRSPSKKKSKSKSYKKKSKKSRSKKRCRDDLGRFTPC